VRAHQYAAHFWSRYGNHANAERHLRHILVHTPDSTGTLVGLINMLQIIEIKDISSITTNMAVALTTTFYGLMLANLMFNPIAIKLERRTEQRIMLMSMLMEGVTLIAERRNPSFIRETLSSFIAHYEDELQDSGKPHHR